MGGATTDVTRSYEAGAGMLSVLDCNTSSSQLAVAIVYQE